MEDETVREVAKAAQEVAKFAQKGVDLVHDIGSYCAKVLGTGPEDLVGVLGGDQLHTYRLVKQARRIVKVQETLKQLGILEHHKPVSPEYFVEWLDAVAVAEEDEDLDTIWTALLTAAADPDYDFREDPSLIWASRHLLPEDARAFKLIYDLSTHGDDGVSLPRENCRSIWVPYYPESEPSNRSVTEYGYDVEHAYMVEKVGSDDLRGIVEKLGHKGLLEVGSTGGMGRADWVCQVWPTVAGLKVYEIVRKYSM